MRRNSNDVTLFNFVTGTLSNPRSYPLPANSTKPVVTFTPDDNYLVTANAKSYDVTLFKVASGVLSGSMSKPLPKGSSVPSAVVSFSDNQEEIVIITANNGSDDITLFAIINGALSEGQSRQIAQGNAQPGSIGLSADGAFLAASNSGSDTIAIIEFSKEAILGNRTTHILPDNSTYCVSIAFSPIFSSTGSSLLATANFYSDDVSISQIFGTSSEGGSSSNGDESSTNIGIIVGPIMGGVGALTGIVVVGIVAYFAWKYFARYRGSGAVNYSPEEVAEVQAL